MGLKVLTLPESLTTTVASLRLTDSSDRVSLVAASLRRAASFLCPSTPSALSAAVKDTLQELVPVDSDLLQETLDALVAAGDLVESLEDHNGQRRRVIFLGQPRYVQRRSGGLILFGTRPDGAPLVGEALQDQLVTSGHLRRIAEPDDKDYSLLDTYGVREVSDSQWMGRPEPAAPISLINSYRHKLGQQDPSGTIENLCVLDPDSSPSFYRRRWRQASTSDDGVFVARRSQGYGADLWCFVEIRGGNHRKFLDLPLNRGARGCDEAWQLQAAIDFENGTPQELLVSKTGRGQLQFGLPSPPPKWLQRRWDLLGQPVRTQRSLFGYEFSSSDAGEEKQFVCDHLWMESQRGYEGELK